jgi:ATP-dependent DNA ligase I
MGHHVCVLLQELVDASEAVRATPARNAKIELLAAALRRLAPDEVPVGVAFLSGKLPQRQIGVGWATLRSLPAPAETAELSVGEIDSAFDRVGALTGPGSQGERRAVLEALFARATEAEQRYLRGLLLGELRQGASAGLMAEAVASAAHVPRAELRRALMLRGDLGAVAAAALEGGADALRSIRLEVGRPVQPMLASTAESVEAALARVWPAALEWKVDGVRIQVHRAGDDVAVFTRSLEDITARVPEVVEAALALPMETMVLDGEAIALRPDGRPEPFQVTGSRLSRQRAGATKPLAALFFDVLHADGEDLIDRSGAERFSVLESGVHETARVPRETVADVAGAEAFLDGAIERGHEGVMVKSLAAPYEAGRRGAGWLKVKPRHTLDLVVLAAEWGHGRRRGTLSNLHLGARDESGGFVMLGKTFKGLTDAMLAWQTERLLELAVARDEWVVHVRPELVVEVAFDGVQTSSRYPGGVALRFARVLRHRPDKPAAEADTLETVLAIQARAAG